MRLDRRRAAARFVRQLIGRMIGVAQQRGALGTQRAPAAATMRVLSRRRRGARAVEALNRRSRSARFCSCASSGCVVVFCKRDQPFARQPAGRRGRGGRADLLGGRALELGGCFDHDRAVRRGLAVRFAGTASSALDELRVDARAAALCPARPEPRAGTHELGVIALQQLARLGVQRQLRRAARTAFDARKQRRIQLDRILVRASNGASSVSSCSIASLPLESLRLKNTAVDRSSSSAATLQGDDRVVEGRASRVVRDGVDLEALRRHAVDEGRAVIGVADAIERRQLVGQAARLRETDCPAVIAAGIP